MGWRFRRSVRIAPGVRLNVGKRGISATVGVRGAHYTAHSSGRRTVSVGLPGTGAYWTETTGRDGRTRPKPTHRIFLPDGETPAPEEFSEQPSSTQDDPPPPPPPPPPSSSEGPARSVPENMPAPTRWSTIVVAILLTSLVIAAKAVATSRGLATTLELATLLLLAVLAVWGFVIFDRHREAPRPREPRPKAAPPIRVPPAPPVEVIVPALTCRICGRPLDSPHSTRMGVGPTCLQRFGTRIQYEINPAHVAWGRHVHEKRLAREDAQRRLDAEVAEERRTYPARLESWKRDAGSRAGLRRRMLRRRALSTVILSFTCGALVATGPMGHASDASGSAIVESPPYPEPSASSSAPEKATPTPTPTPTPTNATTSAPSTSATASAVPSLPNVLSDAAVLHAIPACVGGVCSLLARHDVTSSTAGTRVTVALVNYPTDQYLGTHLGMVSVDAASGSQVKLMSNVDAYGVDTGSARLVFDTRGDVMAIVSSTNSWSLEKVTPLMVSVSGNDAEPQFLLRAGGDTLTVLTPTDGYLTWSARSGNQDGSTTEATWTKSTYGFGAVDCAKSRNGDVVHYAPINGWCDQ